MSSIAIFLCTDPADLDVDGNGGVVAMMLVDVDRRLDYLIPD